MNFWSQRSLRAQARHGRVGAEGDDGVGAAKRVRVELAMRFDELAQGRGQAANEVENFAAGGGVVAVAGKLHHVVRAEEKAVREACHGGDGEIARADVVDDFRRAGANADAVAHRSTVERIDVAELVAQQPQQFRARKKSRIGAGEKIEALAGGHGVAAIRVRAARSSALSEQPRGSVRGRRPMRRKPCGVRSARSRVCSARTESMLARSIQRTRPCWPTRDFAARGGIDDQHARPGRRVVQAVRAVRVGLAGEFAHAVLVPDRVVAHGESARQLRVEFRPWKLRGCGP